MAHGTQVVYTVLSTGTYLAHSQYTLYLSISALGTYVLSAIMSSNSGNTDSRKESRNRMTNDRLIWFKSTLKLKDFDHGDM